MLLRGLKMYEIIQKELKEIMNKNFGARKKDGHCSFCGEILSDGAYCDCPESDRINKYAQKAQKYASDAANFESVYKEKSAILKRNNFKVPALFEGINFNDYQIINSSQKTALNAVKAYANNILENYLFGKNLILLGNYGTGKTMLMSALAKEIATKKLANVLFVNAVDLVNEIKETFSDKSINTTSQVANRYKRVDFLFLDDIDKLNPTQYIQELMYNVVNYRTEKELPLIISANHTLEELDEKYFGEATVSRIAAKSQIIKFMHENWRVA